MNALEQTKAILPIIKLARRNKKNKSEVARHTRYILNQVLYGYEQFAKRYASVNAIEYYRELGLIDNLSNRLGNDQKKFDPKGKKNGKFHVDHIYTIKMFRNAIDSLSDNQLTATNIDKIVKENYAVAWILKSENTLLDKNKHRSIRGITLADALKIYENDEIKIILGG